MITITLNCKGNMKLGTYDPQRRLTAQMLLKVHTHILNITLQKKFPHANPMINLCAHRDVILNSFHVDAGNGSCFWET